MPKNTKTRTWLCWGVILSWMGLIAWGLLVPAQLLAESALCWGGATTLRATLETSGDSANAPNGAVQNTRTLRHATLRALIAVQRCPEMADRVLSENAKVSQQWIVAIPQIIEPYFPKTFYRGAMSQLAQGISCAVDTSPVCEIHQRLLDVAKGASPSGASAEVCTTFGPRLMSEAMADLEANSGKFQILTQELAFLLSGCPESFLAYMHDHPAQFQEWLDDAQGNLFWGGPDDKDSLKAYRDVLIGMVATKSTEYAEEKKRIVKQFKADPVRTIQ